MARVFTPPSLVAAVCGLLTEINIEKPQDKTQIDYRPCFMDLDKIGLSFKAAFNNGSLLPINF